MSANSAWGIIKSTPTPSPVINIINININKSPSPKAAIIKKPEIEIISPTCNKNKFEYF